MHVMRLLLVALIALHAVVRGEEDGQALTETVPEPARVNFEGNKDKVPHTPPRVGNLDGAKDHIPSKPPRMDNADQSGACSRSIFETRIFYTEMLPEEQARRLTGQPKRHPERNICGSYANKDSCCTDDTLKDFQAWSDAVDQSMQISTYIRNQIERDPRLLVDNIILTVRATLPNPDSVDWKAIRTRYREKVGRIIADWWKSMYPPLKKLWADMVTYQEGLLCSACEPNFSRFIDADFRIKVREPAAANLGDDFVGVLNAFDAFLSNQDELARIKDLIQEICTQIEGQAKCMAVPMAVGYAIGYITGSPLRKMICGSAKGDLQVRNEDCKNFMMKQVLRGLSIDTSPIIMNIFNYLSASCPPDTPGVDCSAIALARDRALGAYYTFDERPLATNVYAQDGFDLMGTACGSNLSGYACGGSGPKPNAHKATESSGSNVGAILLTILIVLGVVALGAALWVSRHRLARVTQTFYTRMRDDGTAPTVGLV